MAWSGFRGLNVQNVGQAPTDKGFIRVALRRGAFFVVDGDGCRLVDDERGVHSLDDFEPARMKETAEGFATELVYFTPTENIQRKLDDILNGGEPCLTPLLTNPTLFFSYILCTAVC